MDEQVHATVAAIGFVLLLILAGLSPSPEIGVVLQAGGVGGAFGVLVAYLRATATTRRPIAGGP